jgi:hypothetical protein
VQKLVFGLAFLLGCGLQTLAAEVKTIRVERHGLPGFVGYVPDEIVVQFAGPVVAALDQATIGHGRAGIPGLDQLGQKHKAVSMRQQFPGAKPKQKSGRTIDLSGWHKIRFAQNVDVETVANEYRSLSGVLAAQPIGIHTTYGNQG